jgi:hypothetical protein
LVVHYIANKNIPPVYALMMGAAYWRAGRQGKSRDCNLAQTKYNFIMATVSTIIYGIISMLFY